MSWNRSWEQGDKHERDYASLPLEEKESYRWLKAQASSEVLSDAKQVTHIADREGDIYQLFSRFRGQICLFGLKRTGEPARDCSASI